MWNEGSCKGHFRIKVHFVSRSLDAGQDVRVQEAPVYGFWFPPRAREVFLTHDILPTSYRVAAICQVVNATWTLNLK